MTKKLILGCLLVALCGLFATSCVMRVRPAPLVVYAPPVEYGYQPMLYNGYVVYYTDDGVPFYWDAGVRIWIPVHIRARYVDHWRVHHRSYRTWYKHRGHHYRTRRYKSRSNAVHRGKPRLKPHKKPTLKPHHKSKPVLKPKDKKPTLKPKKKKKPRLKPKDRDD